MGAGTNVQRKLVALHHLDVPWLPSSIEQREGRILRQGNENKKVNIFKYITENTFDSYSWQILENKQKFISQIMTSKSPVRSCEDIDGSSLTYAEVKALATGNPYIKEKMSLDVDVAKLKALKSNYLNQKYKLEDEISQGYPVKIAKLEEIRKVYKKDIEILRENTQKDKKTFLMKIGNRIYADKREAGEKLLTDIKSIENGALLGAYMGFDMIKNFKSYENKVEIILKGEMGHRTEIGTDALGNITRLNNTLNSMTTNLEKVEQEIKETIKQLEKAKIEVSKPFEKEDELQKKMSRLSELDAMLNMDMEERRQQEQDESGKEELKEPKKISVREVLARKKEEVTEQGKERGIAKTEKLGEVMV